MPIHQRLSHHRADTVLSQNSGINILVEFSYIGVAILALSGVLTLAVALAFKPDLTASDQAISTFIQSLRNAPSDSFMVLATMLGDTVVVGALACIMVIALLLTRQWQLSAICTAAFLSAAVFVPFAKTLLQRTRPISLYPGAESFSFPSAHAAYLCAGAWLFTPLPLSWLQ